VTSRRPVISGAGRFTVLAVVSLAPVVLLILRALAATWRYPTLWPSVVEGSALADVVLLPRLRDALVVSFALALGTGLLAAVIGCVAGRAIVRARGGWRRMATAAAFLPVVAPPIALGVGIQVVALRLGLGGDTGGVLLAHLIPAAGYVTLYFVGALQAHDFALEDEARTLGATWWQATWLVTVPLLRARLRDAFVLGALVSWGQLALTLLVGAGSVRTLPVELLSFVRAGDDRLGAAAALVLAVPPLLAMGVIGLGARRTGVVA
jgi:putative spermidine/putrescine transport system permease protein